MAYTLATIIQQVRNLTGDTSVTPMFSDAQLTDFINRAIEDLSKHFPRRILYSVTTTAGTRKYDLPLTAIAVLSAELPRGQNPPRYLHRVDHLSPLFYGTDNNYAFIRPADSSSLNPPYILISQSPPAGLYMDLNLLSEHNALTAGGDVSSILERHIHLIGLFARWKCLQELSTTEAMDPDPLQMRLMTEEINSKRAEAAYRTALDEAKKAFGDSTVSPWKMDKHDRKY